MRQDTGCKDGEHLQTCCTRGEIIGCSHLVQILSAYCVLSNVIETQTPQSKVIMVKRSTEVLDGGP